MSHLDIWSDVRLSITGSTHLDSDGELIVERALKSIPGAPAEFTTGGADGVDTFAAELGFQLYRHRTSIFRLCYPEGFYYNKATRRYANLIVPVPGGYLKRDDALVEFCTTLAAFPRSSEEYLRSGTWATVRRARKAKRIIMVFPLDGSEAWLENPTDPGRKVFAVRY